MPANNNDIEKRLWDAADELRANSKLNSLGVFRPGAGVDLPALCRPQFSAGRGMN